MATFITVNVVCVTHISPFISFRNLLVHRYGKVDEKQEYVNTSENHTNVLDFLREIKLFIKKAFYSSFSFGNAGKRCMKKYLLLIEDENLWKRFKSVINNDLNSEILSLIKEKVEKKGGKNNGG